MGIPVNSCSHQGAPVLASIDQLPSILTLKEVSKELRCSKAHLSHIINGKVAGLPPLPFARIGRRVIIRRAALLNWLWTVEGRDGIMGSDLNSSLETHGKE
jgi:hypothetical protein